MILLQFTPELAGDSEVAKHEKWIAVDAVQWGLGRAISASGAGADRDTSNPSFSEVSISKNMDIASCTLMQEAACGVAMTKAVLHFIQTGGKDAEGQHYLEIVLEKPIISSYSMSSGGERPTESFSISFNAITMDYIQLKDGAAVGTSKPKGYDLKTNKPKNAIS